MFDLQTTLHAQACNNTVANHRLLRTCSGLSQAALAAERTGFFPSIIHTLNHILTVDWFYVSALEDACIGYAAFMPEIPCPEFDDLAREQRAVDLRLRRLCEQLTDADLSRPVALVRVCCCTCSSTRSIIVARSTRCSRVRQSRRRSLMSSFSIHLMSAGSGRLTSKNSGSRKISSGQPATPFAERLALISGC
jgi:uncharacterized damage-inducible protein DinB